MGGSLVAASAIVYTVQLLLFDRATDTFFYLMQDLAFLPVQVLLVTLILNELFKRRERAVLQRKMNMVIGAFFSEVGTGLLTALGGCNARAADIKKILAVGADWTDRDFQAAIDAVRSHEPGMDCRSGDLAALKTFLTGKRGFLLGLLENPNLLEHETFTDLLWAVFHLTEELGHRRDVAALPETDYAHLSGDMKRAYLLLVSEWLAYTRHLKGDYPYIFSLLVRTSPFDENASPEVL